MNEHATEPWKIGDSDSVFHDDGEVIAVVTASGEPVLSIGWGGFACESDPYGAYPILEASDEDWELILSAPALLARVAKLEAALRAIIDDASPCTSACSRMVDESLLDAAGELLESQ